MKRLVNIAALLLIVGLARIAFSQTEAPISVAVLTLDATGIDMTVAETITEYLRDQLRLESRLEIMYREVMLDKLALRKELVGPFTENEELLGVGEILSTRKIVAGSMGKVGDFFTISLKIFDIQDGTSFEIADDHTGTKDSFQYETIENVANRIIEKILDEIEQKPASLSESAAEEKSSVRWYKKWWVWASAAGGAALIGGAAIIAGSKDEEKPPVINGDGQLPTPPDLP